MTDERMEYIRHYAETRLQVGDILSAYALELIQDSEEKQSELNAAKEEITRLRRLLGEIP